MWIISKIIVLAMLVAVITIMALVVLDDVFEN